PMFLTFGESHSLRSVPMATISADNVHPYLQTDSLPDRQSTLVLQHLSHPVLIVQVPLDRFANAKFKGIGRVPAQFAADFFCVNSISPIVARAVFDKTDQVTRGLKTIRSKLVERVANEFDNT